MKFAKTLAIDIGGTYIKYGIVEANGEIHDQYKVPTADAGTGKELFDYIVWNIKSLSEIELIGVSAPGLIDQGFFVRSYAAPKLSALYGCNIRQEMEKRTGIRTAAINDGKAAGLCELKMGRAVGTKLSAYLIIGTGAAAASVRGTTCFQEQITLPVNFISWLTIMRKPEK